MLYNYWNAMCTVLGKFCWVLKKKQHSSFPKKVASSSDVRRLQICIQLIGHDSAIRLYLNLENDSGEADLRHFLFLD